jgi:hypothetical protein
MIWGDYTLSQNREKKLEFKNLLALYLARVEQEVWLAWERSGTGSDEATSAEESSDQQTQVSIKDDAEENQPPLIDLKGRSWSRWALKSKQPEISIKPMFPDLPFVVRPDYPFRLAPGAEAKIYTRIPVAIGIYDKSDNMLKLMELNSVDMVKTWFGTFEGGEVCYWLPTTASQVVRQNMFRPHRVYCPVVIQNKSSDFLHVEKLCLRVDRLSIYEAKGKLWSDCMSITYNGSDRFSDLVAEGKPPAEAPDAALISRPRNPVSRGIAEQTFKLLNISEIVKNF